ncbi:hypothetical protein BX666DRAFT_1954795 [Dichotomocladium elegans]|nr:hypothetical protein BX666DRAFT_2016481 [Dichotomocladium elegans]KAI9309757.1 hypothetical protein BX666DRAFT_2016482 [Dichotomocladium elegans]KAI9309952.1 hypothetical protein BX666DRAFT_2014786 [Dichotomocladium elegans]KAI9316078.1 hypothetical protein BX666DRAFT_1954795 [Dichotomocladium elegans]
MRASVMVGSQLFLYRLPWMYNQAPLTIKVLGTLGSAVGLEKFGCWLTFLMTLRP